MKSIFLLLQFLIVWSITSMAQEKDSVEILVEVIITSTVEINEKLDKSFSEKLQKLTMSSGKN